MYLIKTKPGMLMVRVALLLLATAGSICLAEPTNNVEKRPVFLRGLDGVVMGNGNPQADYEVSLYASYNNGQPLGILGTAISDSAGHFDIRYTLPAGLWRNQKLVLYVLAEKGPSLLATAIGDNSLPVVVNERTTVATGAAFAQFIDGREIRGNKYGMLNAVKMAANMANPETGAVGAVLDTAPNADENSTRKTFNSLANMVARCVADSVDCDSLFEMTTPAGGPAPATVLQALANMTRYPASGFAELLDFALAHPFYGPALAADTKQTSWLLFIKFTGQAHSVYDAHNLMSGPGNVAFDERGFAWINDNYIPTADLQVACAGLRLMKFYPWGESFPGSPYFGGGLEGAGFGIGIDPRGRVLVGNFGFEAPLDACSEVAARHDSFSMFKPDGTPISPPNGFTEGHIWWPQATVSDKKGNVWMANCGNDTVTFVPGGKARRAKNFALPGGRGEEGIFYPSIPDTEENSDAPVLKPFGLAIDPQGRAWVTANQVGYVSGGSDQGEAVGGIYRVSSDGSVETLSTLDIDAQPVLSWPMGIAGDSKGNMWISNSNSVKVPCVDSLDPQDGDEGPSVTLYPADDSAPIQYTGGGLSIPWGNAVDGNDTLWVFNFGVKPTDIVDANTEWPDTPLSHFCGVDVSQCPAGLSQGDPISPASGYVSDVLDRITGGNIDPSGNVWLMNNWKKTGPFERVYNSSPGGNSFVIIPGAAGPVKTPLIGPPNSF